MGIKEVRIFRNNDTLLFNRNLIENGSFVAFLAGRSSVWFASWPCRASTAQSRGGKCASTRNFM